MFTHLDTTSSSRTIVVLLDTPEPVDLDVNETHDECIAFAREVAHIGDDWYVAEGPHRPASAYSDIELVFMRD